jgi:hypothetical protein
MLAAAWITAVATGLLAILAAVTAIVAGLAFRKRRCPSYRVVSVLPSGCG